MNAVEHAASLALAGSADKSAALSGLPTAEGNRAITPADFAQALQLMDLVRSAVPQAMTVTNGARALLGVAIAGAAIRDAGVNDVPAALTAIYETIESFKALAAQLAAIPPAITTETDTNG